MAGSVEPTPVIASVEPTARFPLRHRQSRHLRSLFASVEPTAHGLIVWWTAMQVVRYAAGDWGVGELWFDGEVPVWHELPTMARAHPGPHPPHPPKGAAGPPVVTLAEPGARDWGDSVPEVARLVTRYFAGARVSFARIRLDLEWCTPFQLAVAETLRAVPYGETVTYGELAALAGHPNAQRAAGSFCAQNRLPLLLPCHRVVAAGGLGSYGSLGLDYKRRLLELEDAAL